MKYLQPNPDTSPSSLTSKSFLYHPILMSWKCTQMDCGGHYATLQTN